MRELLWVLIGLLFVYVLYQLYRARALSGGLSYYDGFDESGEKASAAFAATLESSAWRQELEVLRAEVERQRAIVEQLSSNTEALRNQLESISVAQGISPEYNEALVCARQGLDVEAIAERCNISVAEAELVRSMAERQGEGSGV